MKSRGENHKGFQPDVVVVVFPLVERHILVGSLYSTWKMVSPAFDRRFEKYKAPLFKDAYGVVIDIGSGTGDNLRSVRHLVLSSVSCFLANCVEVCLLTSILS